MKITNISNSHLTEITSDEASHVNGGSGYSSVPYVKVYDDYFDFSIFTDFLKNKPKIYPQIKGYSAPKDYYKIDFAPIDSPTKVSESSSKDTALYL